MNTAASQQGIPTIPAIPAIRAIEPAPSAVGPPQLTLLGTVMSDHYQVASVVLAFARNSALDRERCWALALGTATLAACAGPAAMMCIERSDTRSIRVRLYGSWDTKSEATLSLTLSRLRDVGFRTRPSREPDLLLELVAAP